MSKHLYKVDQYGVREYHALPIVLMAFSILYASISALAALLFYFEHNAPGANILSYQDAFWTMQMAASTIGFGDFYPITPAGRWCTSAMFYIGVGIVAALGSVFHKKLFGFTNTDVQNRELRAQLSELLEHNKQLENRLIEMMLDEPAASKGIEVFLDVEELRKARCEV